MSTVDNVIEGFPNYVESTNDPGLALDLFILVYSVLSALLVVPLVVWGRQHEKQRQDASLRARPYHQSAAFANDPMAQQRQQQQQQRQYQMPHHQQQLTPPPPPHTPQLSQGYPQNLETQSGDPHPGPGLQNEGHSLHRRIPMTFFREIDRVSQRYPDEDPDFMSVISASQQLRSRASGSVISGSQQQRSDGHAPAASHSQAASNAEQSHVLSVATTSRLYQPGGKGPKTQVWDVGARRWKQRRPIGRPYGIHRAIQSETQTMGMSTERRELTAHSSGPGSRASSRPSRLPSVSRGMSEIASTILTTEEHDNTVHRVVLVVAQPGPSSNHRQQSFSSASGFPTVVDDISPNDAADAADPGRVNLIDQDEISITVCCGPTALWTPRVILMALDGLISLAEPDLEMQRIVSLGLPLTIGAMWDVLLRAITIAFISREVGTDSMIAFVIVNLLMGFTDELVGAVADAENALCSYALTTGQPLLAGQYVQISTVFHTLLAVPFLTMWTLTMEDIVYWFVESRYTALVAKEYTKIIVFHHFLQSFSRIFTVLFQLTGNETFETRFSLAESVLTAVVICVVVSFDASATLSRVAWLQLSIGTVGFIFKLSYAVYKEWFRVFRKGILSLALTNRHAVTAVVFSSLPLLLGAFLEYGEWEMLLFFVTRLGPAEVATWSILGVLWKVLETSTEGIGEAAATRVAYHLGHNNPDMAKRASYKAVFISAIQSFFVTAILLMCGKDLSSWLTTDATLQRMLNDTMTLLGIGNVVMTYSMTMWSLVGAQGRYRLATIVILISRWLVTIPCSAVMVFAFNLDLNCLLGSVIIGFSTAGMSLAYVLIRSDWERLAKILQELNAMMEYESESDESSEEEE